MAGHFLFFYDIGKQVMKKHRGGRTVEKFLLQGALSLR